MTEAQWLAPDLRCLRAPNPGPLTGPGTNTYIVGQGTVAVIDPGPDDPAHLGALLSTLGAHDRVSHILVTHSHLDHSPLAAALSRTTGAPVCAFGDSHAGRSDVMRALAAGGALGGGEGVDAAFTPDVVLADGAVVEAGRERLQALWTPGHIGNHLCFLWRGHAFSGDHVMGWATTLVSPPDGDLTAFMASLERLEAAQPERLFPGHGDPVDNAMSRIDALRTHRRAREAAIIDRLAAGVQTIPSITADVYVDLPATLLPAASRNVLAHLIDLITRGIVSAHPSPNPNAKFHLRAQPTPSAPTE